MKYFVVSDVHGFYTLMYNALENAGFFREKEPCKLVVCGDLLDRGCEAVKMQEFMMELLKQNKLIFIRGNHEDLMLCMLDDIIDNPIAFATGSSYHIRNGTFDTALQLSGMDASQALRSYRDFVFKTRQSAFCKNLIPESVNYYETENYVFVHGWIPSKTRKFPGKETIYEYDSDWRSATPSAWREARWFNGMKLAGKHNVIEPSKTIVCGHWHTSYGHATFEGRGAEFDCDADFSPYIEKGIIALDGCVAYSHQVNCIVLEE